MKRVWLTILIVVVIAFLFLSNPAGFFTAKTNSIKIGGAFALSGFASQWGEAELRGAALAVDEINSKGDVNGRKIELIVEDVASDSTKSVSAVSKLVYVDGVSVIIGPTWLDSFGGAAPVADENNVVMITPSASITAVKSAKNYTYVFSTWYRTNKEAQELIRHLSASGRKKIILFFGNDPFWQDFSNDLKQSSKNTDIEILQELRFNSVETDFRTHLIKIKSLNPDAIIFGLNDEKALLSFLQQRAILYPDSNLYTTEYIEEFASKDDYNGLLNNVTFISPKSVENEFSEKYRKRFGSNPVFSASNSYDATRMAIQAMENGNFNSADIREYLVRNVFETATFGKISFDEIGGISSGEFVIKTI